MLFSALASFVPRAAGFVYVSKLVSGILSGLDSGSLPEAIGRYFFVRMTADRLNQGGFPFTQIKWTLQVSEFGSRADPFTLVLGLLGPSGLGVLPAASSLTESLLQEALQAPDLDPAAANVINGFLEVERTATFLGILERVLRGLGVGNSPSSVRNAARAGDPIVLRRGEFERQQADLHVAGAGIDFELRRTYRSSVVFFGPMGPDWNHSYNLRIREVGEYIAVRVTGDLSEQTYIKHPGAGDAAFDYYVPPNGVHAVLMRENGSFVLAYPGGLREVYEPAEGALGDHRVARIEDRLGHRLSFVYGGDDQLKRVFVNSEHRWVRFSYDELGRLVALDDHSGRSVFYAYDDFGYLARVSAPRYANDANVWKEHYRYRAVAENIKLSAVLDWRGRTIVENEYDAAHTSEFFGHVVRQYRDGATREFFYETIPWDHRSSTPVEHIPALRVREYSHDGHEIEHVLNEFGNELVTREKYLDVCHVRERVTLRRFNADGEIVAQIDPDGSLSQRLLAREHLADELSWPAIEHVLGPVPRDLRMSFGNVLAEVVRKTKLAPHGAFDLDLWAPSFPSCKAASSSEYTITKYTYDAATQLPLSRSDPRATESADPLHAESEAHRARLTRFEYAPTQRHALVAVHSPRRTHAEPWEGAEPRGEIVQRMSYAEVSGKLRMRESRDARGYVRSFEYYAASDGAKEGFTRSVHTPHVDWILDSSFPDILEVEKLGDWQADESGFVSTGADQASFRVRVEGVELRLFQTVGRTLPPAGGVEVAVRVDGISHGHWDQAQHADYLISGLAGGWHQIELRGSAGARVGRVSSHVLTVYEVDALGRTARVVDPMGGARSEEFDASGRVVRSTVTLPVPCVTEYTHDPAGRTVLERRRWQGHLGDAGPERWVVVEQVYDQAGRLLELREHGDGELRKRTYAYDVEGRVAREMNPRGFQTTFTYDTLGRRTRVTKSACTPEQVTLTTTYTPGGKVLSQRNGRGAVTSNGHRLPSGELIPGFDARGNATVELDALSNLVVRDYDERDELTVVRRFERSANAYHLISRIENTYDELGQLKRSDTAVFSDPIHAADPLGDPDREYQLELLAGEVELATTTHLRDAAGFSLETRHPDGALVRRAFDSAGRNYDSITPKGERVFTIFDGSGNVRREYRYWRSPGDDSTAAVFVEDYEYDAKNRLVARIDSHGHRWESAYDTLDRVTKTVDPLGNVVRFEYDAFGDMIAETHERSSSGLGEGTPLAPAVTRYEYDKNGNLTSITDPAQSRVELEYDSLDRHVETRFTSDSKDTRERRSYDAAGNLTVLATHNGHEVHKEYDLLDRNVHTTVSALGAGGSGAHPPSDHSSLWSSYRYDAAGHLVAHENEHCKTEISRDSRGLPVGERVLLSDESAPTQVQVILRSFDLGGRRSRLTYPSGWELEYAHDDGGRVRAIRDTDTDAEISRYAYVGAGLRELAFRGGERLELVHDGRGHVIERSLVGRSGETLWRCQLLRDAATVPRVEHAVTASGARTRKFAYDSQYQLTHYWDAAESWLTLDDDLRAPIRPIAPGDAAAIELVREHIGSLLLPSTDAVFEYDLCGNRIRAREPSLAPVDSQVNALHQYEQVGGEAWDHDPNGNARATGARTLGYDFRDALTEVHESPGTEVSMLRDALGRIVVERSTSSVAVLHDGTRRLMEFRDGVAAEYVIGHDGELPVYMRTPGSERWLVYDARASLRVVLDQDGGITLPSYRPFGAPEDDQLESCPCSPAFAGMTRHVDTGLYHTAHRVYDPTHGRFLQRDPAGFADHVNPYIYALNSPLLFSDPTGLSVRADLVGALDKIGLQLTGALREFGLHTANAFVGAVKNVQEGFETFGAGMTKIGAGKIGPGVRLVLTAGVKLFLQTPFDFLLTMLAASVSAFQTALGLEKVGRPLTAQEKALLQPIFGSGLDYDAVRIKEGGAGVFTANDRPFVLGNVIYMKHTLNDMATAGAVGNWGFNLVHEAVHVWQHQVGGTDYMSEALFAQWFGDAYHWHKGSMLTKSWATLDPEQQAELVRDARFTNTFNVAPTPSGTLFGPAHRDHGPLAIEAINALRHRRRTP